MVTVKESDVQPCKHSIASYAQNYCCFDFILRVCVCMYTSFSSTNFLVFKNHQREPTTSHKKGVLGLTMKK